MNLIVISNVEGAYEPKYRAIFDLQKGRACVAVIKDLSGKRILMFYVIASIVVTNFKEVIDSF